MIEGEGRFSNKVVSVCDICFFNFILKEFVYG